MDIYGERPECINISLLQDRMANLGVKPAEVLATLNGQNETTYSGYYDNGDNRIRVTVNDRFKTVDDIGKMFIQGHDDDQLRLRDIALIEKGYEDPTRNEMFYNQERSYRHFGSCFERFGYREGRQSRGSEAGGVER